MKSKEIREKFLQFFEEKGHKIIPSAPLLPENDPTVLFTTAGMHPLVPFLLGEPHPMGKRLVNHQKCIRTGDIDEVGDNTHLTFFEMLGNWSLGDYFKKEAIDWSFEFLTSEKWLNIPLEKLAVSVFEGDDDAPFDEEAAEEWKKRGIPEHKIAKLPKKENWWGPAGQTGPCGPDTEMFYWVGEGTPPEDSNPGNDEDNWIEIWNDVFMQYNKTADGKFEPLKQTNVDTGMGLDRVAAVLQGKKTVYDTELFQPIIAKILSEAGVAHEAIDDVIPESNYPTGPVGSNLPRKKAIESVRIIADHLRAATFMAGDGVKPSNVDQGYVMRRLMRRAIRHGRTIGINHNFTATIAKKVIHLMVDVFSELQHEEEILEVFREEEERFRKTLEQGIHHLKKIYGKVIGGFDPENLPPGMRVEKNKLKIDGKEVFHVYETYGIPPELSQEIMTDWGVEFDEQTMKESDEAFKKHQETSRAGAEQKFTGGLADHSEECKRLHTATHLVHQALKDVLGDHVLQKGSNITRERLRFDFNHDQKMTPEQIKQVEDIVNEQIQKDLPIHFELMEPDVAKAQGVIGVFDDKYAALGNQIKVYFMGDYSKEICGGPHMDSTGQLGSFKIKKEQSCSAGIRRIKAIVGGNQ